MGLFSATRFGFRGKDFPGGNALGFSIDAAAGKTVRKAGKDVRRTGKLVKVFYARREHVRRL